MNDFLKNCEHISSLVLPNNGHLLSTKWGMGTVPLSFGFSSVPCQGRRLLTALPLMGPLPRMSLPPMVTPSSGPAPVPRTGSHLGAGLVSSPTLGQQQQQCLERGACGICTPQFLSLWGFLGELRQWTSLSFHVVSVLFHQWTCPKLVDWSSLILS